ncbi:hypothetical protein ISCGN_004228 [Ixodes scapularis]
MPSCPTVLRVSEAGAPGSEVDADDAAMVRRHSKPTRKGEYSTARNETPAYKNQECQVVVMPVTTATFSVNETAEPLPPVKSPTSPTLGSSEEAVLWGPFAGKPSIVRAEEELRRPEISEALAFAPSRRRATSRRHLQDSNRNLKVAEETRKACLKWNSPKWGQCAFDPPFVPMGSPPFSTDQGRAVGHESSHGEGFGLQLLIDVTRNSCLCVGIQLQLPLILKALGSHGEKCPHHALPLSNIADIALQLALRTLYDVSLW